MYSILSNNIYFRGNKTEPSVNKTEHSQNLEKLVQYSVEHVKDRGEREVCEYGPFKSIAASFPLEGTQNEALISLECDPEDNKQSRVVKAACRRNSSDLAFFEYLAEGNKKEILNYLDNKENLLKIKEAIKSLSDEVDKYYANL